jgi:phage portal protein BeeE
LLPSAIDGERYRFTFDTTTLVRGTFNEQVAALQIAVQTGVMTRNEAREMMGFPPIEGGDEVLIGPNLLPPEMNREQAESGDSDGPGSPDGDE